jgi:hypothetical protein
LGGRRWWTCRSYGGRCLLGGLRLRRLLGLFGRTAAGHEALEEVAHAIGPGGFLRQR